MIASTKLSNLEQNQYQQQLYYTKHSFQNSFKNSRIHLDSFEG